MPLKEGASTVMSPKLHARSVRIVRMLSRFKAGNSISSIKAGIARRCVIAAPSPILNQGPHHEPIPTRLQCFQSCQGYHACVPEMIALGHLLSSLKIVISPRIAPMC